MGSVLECGVQLQALYLSTGYSDLKGYNEKMKSDKNTRKSITVVSLAVIMITSILSFAFTGATLAEETQDEFWVCELSGTSKEYYWVYLGTWPFDNSWTVNVSNGEWKSKSVTGWGPTILDIPLKEGSWGKKPDDEIRAHFYRHEEWTCPSSNAYFNGKRTSETTASGRFYGTLWDCASCWEYRRPCAYSYQKGEWSCYLASLEFNLFKPRSSEEYNGWLTFYGKDSIKTWYAESGDNNPDHQHWKNCGPIPEGKWEVINCREHPEYANCADHPGWFYLDPVDVNLAATQNCVPTFDPNTHELISCDCEPASPGEKRGGFYIHPWGNSSGCIKLYKSYLDELKAMYNKIREEYNGPIYLFINYHSQQNIRTHSPVDLIVTDPDGLTISKESSEIPNAVYTEEDVTGDGEPDDTIEFFDRKMGYYRITVIPEPNASSTDTYDLEISAEGVTTTLAENISISEIPDRPHITNSTETEIINIGIDPIPIANISGPYHGDEDSSITFDASNSSDPDGDPLQYRWDFDNDENWDTEWLNSSTATYAWSDDYTGIVKLEVSDGEFTETDTAPVVIMNVPPTVEAGEDMTVQRNDLVQFNGSFSDPGNNDTHTIEWDFGDGSNASGTLTPKHVYSDDGVYTVALTVTDDDWGMGLDTLTVTILPLTIFDTSTGTYSSIMGIHNGTITPSHNVVVNKMYTYPCVGTGGHSEHVRIYNKSGTLSEGHWNGYQGDYHNITLTPSITLLKDHEYNYTIVTGSYPQIIHATSKEVTGGTITCTSFVDANGKVYHDWIPAIRLE